MKEAASPPLSVVGCPLSEGRDEVLRACREPGFGESAWDRAAQEEAASPPLSVVGELGTCFAHCQAPTRRLSSRVERRRKRAASPPLSVVGCPLSVGLKRAASPPLSVVGCPLSVGLKRRLRRRCPLSVVRCRTLARKCFTLAASQASEKALGIEQQGKRRLRRRCPLSVVSCRCA